MYVRISSTCKYCLDYVVVCKFSFYYISERVGRQWSAGLLCHCEIVNSRCTYLTLEVVNGHNYIHTFVRTMYVHLYVCTHIWTMYVCVYLHTYVCTDVRMYVRMYTICYIYPVCLFDCIT